MSIRLFHVSEEPDIQVFEPRPSPMAYDQLHDDVVFTISEKLLHNYLLPRNCPRVTYYAGSQTTPEDKAALLSRADHVIALEASWRPTIKETVLYCYELPTDSFELLDENAGYYISYEPVIPLTVIAIRDPLKVLADRRVEVIFLASLWPLAERVQNSTLSFSLIRMSHAERRG